MSIYLRALAVGCIAALTGCVEPDAGVDASLGKTATRATCRVASVIDGDTVRMACRGRPVRNVRLVGFDTPESFEPRCEAELRAGLVAKAALRRKVHSARTTDFDRQGVDRYGRPLMRLFLDGTDVADLMILEGYAVPYSGGRRINWCDMLT